MKKNEVVLLSVLLLILMLGMLGIGLRQREEADGERAGIDPGSHR
ncbi:MAG: hypothetical protein V8S87_03065 [Oscillospiraceae bacterium]